MQKKIEEHDSTKLKKNTPAPGRPGVKPSWSSGAKTAVGTALSAKSRVWFTIRSGILNEVYFPDVDCANTHGLSFLVADGKKFFSDEEHDADHKARWMEAGVPGAVTESVCKKGKYRIATEVITDPDRDVLYLNVSFKPTILEDDLHLYLFCNPHMRDQGAGNDAWVGRYKGIPMLFAQRRGLSLAAACSQEIKAASCGYAGKSDGLQDLQKHKRLKRFYTKAMRGNVAWIAEIDWRKCDGRFRIALGFGGHPAEAALQARIGLLDNFDSIRQKYVSGWQAEQARLACPDVEEQAGDHFKTSLAVLKTHESKAFPGGFVASLSIPWGFDRGDTATGGYHVLWPRDLGETVLGLLMTGDVQAARRALQYLRATQDADGNWSQNMWLDGTPHWTATQMDGTSLPILVADALRRQAEPESGDFWPMIKAAAAFLARTGPYTEQDRWESNAGYSPYTMAVQIAALLAAADFADAASETAVARFLRSTADAWNDAIDELTYISGTKLAKKCGVDGYYIRIMPPEGLQAKSLTDVPAELKNQAIGSRTHRAVDIVSPDALALVRFGLRSATDPRILDTVKVIDRTLKTQTKTGPVWHRYTHDGYGEHDDGSPFRKTGKGRGWPLLAGERAHYEIAKGDFDAADKLRRTMEAQTSECGLFPEQVWDGRHFPKRQLFNGRPTGSGMPLVWAHAEYMKLLRSLNERRVWNMPPQTVKRYVIEKQTSSYQIWTKQQQRTRVSAGKDLRVDSTEARSVHWTIDNWRTTHQAETSGPDLGLRWAVLPISQVARGGQVEFKLPPHRARFAVTVV